MNGSARTIRVRGTGKLSAAPDYILISLTLETTKKDYSEALEDANALLKALKGACAEVGFDEKELKTSSYNVETSYKSVRGADGSYHEEFVGYVVTHSLNLGFDFDSAYLGRVLCAIAGSIADPKINLRFTLKDKDRAARALLVSAAKDAKEKAQILAEASGVSLGELLTIDYDFASSDAFSKTDYRVEDRCMKLACAAPSFEPENIELSDSAGFIFELK